MRKIILALSFALLAFCAQPAKAFSVPTYGKIIPNDPSMNMYAGANRGYYLDSGLKTISGTSETTLFLITNPSANNYKLKIFYQSYADTTSGHSAFFHIYYAPTCSNNGTAATPVNSLIQASMASSTVNAYTGPTCSSNGTLISSYAVSNYSGVANIITPVFVSPGQTVVITVTVSNASDAILATLYWGEE